MARAVRCRTKNDVQLHECGHQIDFFIVSSLFAIRMQSAMNDWLVWQLADSAFPTGGFSHSGGLEAAWQQGEVHSRADLTSFLEASLRQIGRGTLPFVMCAHHEPARLAELDRLCEAFTTNHVANRASRGQGRAFLAAAERIFGLASLPPPYGHLAPIFGAVMSRLEAKRQTTTHLFLFNHLRGLTASAVRLGIVGPMEAQRLQFALTPLGEEVLDHCRKLTLDDLAQTAPILEIWQGGQDRLYSRLFQS